MSTLIPYASPSDTLRAFRDIILPTVAKGVIRRRPTAVALAERLALDRRAIRRMQRLRNRYGPGPVRLRVPGRRYALILSPQHVHRVLEQSPEAFSVVTAEKRAALSHFEPQGVLISRGAARADRRRFNETVLDSRHAMHRLAERFVAVAEAEADSLLAEWRRRGELRWSEFTEGWFRLVRRVVFGDGARDDREVTDLLARLRADANWAFLKPRRTRLRERFLARLDRRLQEADRESLGGVMADAPATRLTAPAQQVPQWLFASDAAGIATFRTLALLATHPEQAARARREIAEPHGAAPRELPYLRACVLESVRLWPTVPLLLRQSAADTVWETGIMPADTGIVIFAQFFHRDDQRLPCANSLAPELWLEERTARDWPLIPFSEGPATCPGRNLVLLLGSSLLARLVGARSVRLKAPSRLDARRPLPHTLNYFTLRFELA
jgi:cytochrome P450